MKKRMLKKIAILAAPIIWRKLRGRRGRHHWKRRGHGRWHHRSRGCGHASRRAWL